MVATAAGVGLSSSVSSGESWVAIGKDNTNPCTPKDANKKAAHTSWRHQAEEMRSQSCRSIGPLIPT
ncbi:hypothetical protein [Halomicronema hongdechloris]|uniref:hypothetical protein n=1 Tax=Halomicronema hongdechloris TaxID=1209493 RepID=UPI0010CB6B06|nr:hypothetical protein [Halomicronema hongdechloris]